MLSDQQKIKDEFKKLMLRLVKFYEIQAKQEIERASLANAIAKYFKENAKENATDF